TNAPAAISESARGHSRSGWAYWGKAQDKHRNVCRSGDLLGRCDILEVEIRDAPGDKLARRRDRQHREIRSRPETTGHSLPAGRPTPWDCQLAHQPRGRLWAQPVPIGTAPPSSDLYMAPASRNP